MALDCYVDGSYRSGKLYSGGVYFPTKSKAFFIIDNKFAKERQVGGELVGAILALLYYKIHPEYSQITIYYDYLGTGKWATGDWQAKSEAAKDYVLKYNKIYNSLEPERRNIFFKHVKGHQKDNNIHHINNNVIDDIVGHVLVHNSYKKKQIYQWTVK